MRHIALLALACLPLIAEEPPAYPCHRVAVAPVIEGKVLDDPAWLGVPGVTGFRKLGAGYTVAKQTTAFACWDDEALTLAMVCEEPDAARLKPQIRDGGQTWTEDSVEIFVQPGAKGQTFQIGVTCGGAKGAGEGKPDIAACQAAATVGADRYELELRIPYAAIGAKPPDASSVWAIAFCRNIWTTESGGDKFTSWPSLQARFLEPEHFARLVFSDRTLAPAEARKLALDSSADYRRELAAAAKAAAERADEYLAELAAAAQDARFAKQAGELADQWRALRGVAARAEQAPPEELRASVRRLDALVDASYTLKYTYLMERLFDEK